MNHINFKFTKLFPDEGTTQKSQRYLLMGYKEINEQKILFVLGKKSFCLYY